MLKRCSLIGAVTLAIFFLYVVGWITLRDIPAPYVEWDVPEHPVAKSAYDLAHAIKLPDSVPKATPFSFCKNEFLGLCFAKATPDDYFAHLCKSEAGEFVFKTVENVEGAFHMMPRFSPRWTEDLRNRHRLEDPVATAVDASFNPLSEGSVGDWYVQPRLGRYQYFDAYYWAYAKKDLIRHYRDPNADPSGKKTIHIAGDRDYPWVLAWKKIESSDARYGITQRGIRRERDREFRIAGGETIIFDRQTGEVLAVKREFARSAWVPNSPSGVFWETAMTCSKLHEKPLYFFIYSVLKPALQEN